jgi:CSLREA domain-containing protein
MRAGLVALALATTMTAISGVASAAVITPNTLNDESNTGASCALREAVQAANTDAPFGGCPGGSGADTIPLAAGTYTLSIPPDVTEDDNLDGDLDVATGSDVTLTHAGISATAISGGGVDRVLGLLTGGTAAISGVTIRDGRPLTDFGGAIKNDDGTLVISNSTLTANTANNNGGALENFNGGTATLTNVTVSGNTASGLNPGGGIRNAGPSTLNLTNVTITGNTAGDAGGLSVGSATTNLSNTIIAGNTDTSPAGTNAPDCETGNPITSLGNNLIGDTSSCGYTPAPSDKVNVNPLLGTLADNGGSTFTHALLTGSPAINGGGPGAAPTDQRGVPRSSDIGAYELATCGTVVVNRVGTSGTDTLTGTSGADGILGLDGKDTLKGLGGKDGLCGGNGKDTLKGGGGKDKLLGEAGKDKLKGGAGNDTLKGGKGNDTLIGGKGKDKLKGGPGKDKQKQ